MSNPEHEIECTMRPRATGVPCANLVIRSPLKILPRRRHPPDPRKETILFKLFKAMQTTTMTFDFSTTTATTTTSKQYEERERKEKEKDRLKIARAYKKSFELRGYSGRSRKPKDEKIILARKARGVGGSKKERRYQNEFAGRGKSVSKTAPLKEPKPAYVLVARQPAEHYAEVPDNEYSAYVLDDKQIATLGTGPTRGNAQLAQLRSPLVPWCEYEDRFFRGNRHWCVDFRVKGHPRCRKCGIELGTISPKEFYHPRLVVKSSPAVEDVRSMLLTPLPTLESYMADAAVRGAKNLQHATIEVQEEASAVPLSSQAEATSTTSPSGTASEKFCVKYPEVLPNSVYIQASASDSDEEDFSEGRKRRVKEKEKESDEEGVVYEHEETNLEKEAESEEEGLIPDPAPIILGPGSLPSLPARLPPPLDPPAPLPEPAAPLGPPPPLPPRPAPPPLPWADDARMAAILPVLRGRVLNQRDLSLFMEQEYGAYFSTHVLYTTNYQGEQRLVTQRNVRETKQRHRLVELQGYLGRSWLNTRILLVVFFFLFSFFAYTAHDISDMVHDDYSKILNQPYRHFRIFVLSNLFTWIAAGLAAVFHYLSPLQDWNRRMVRVLPALGTLSVVFGMIPYLNVFTNVVSVLELANMIYILSIRDAGRISVIYSPHMVSSIYQEISHMHLNALTLKANASQVARRLATLPIEDKISDAVFRGSVDLACWLQANGGTGFTIGQDIPGVPTLGALLAG